MNYMGAINPSYERALSSYAKMDVPTPMDELDPSDQRHRRQIYYSMSLLLKKKARKMPFSE